MSLLKRKINYWKLFRGKRAMFLAYDQGMEHGPTDFNDKNVDPEYIINIAKKGGFTGVIFQKGIVEKYIDSIKKSRVPLVVKLNGKTNLVKGDPVSRQLCSVDEAIELGATAVGYTIYIGSVHEEEMMTEFIAIQREAHKKGLPIIAWIYPRGKSLKGKKNGDLLAYATRVGLELGADIIKIHWDGKKKEDLSWAVKSAGKAKVVIAGGAKKNERGLLKEIQNGIDVGITGIAIGRNVWQSRNPLGLAKKLRKVIWGTIEKQVPKRKK